MPLSFNLLGDGIILLVIVVLSVTEGIKYFKNRNKL